MFDIITVIHVKASMFVCVRVKFINCLWNGIPLYQIFHSLFSQFTIDGYLGYFQFGAMMKSVAMNILADISYKFTYTFLGYLPSIYRWVIG